MMEWVALLVLIPAIVVPIALAFGFAGCETFFPLEFEPTFEPTFEATLTGNRGRDGRCVVQRIEPTRLLRSGSQVQITVRAGTNGNLVIDRLFISQAADVGDPYDAASDLTPVASTVFVAADTALTLPPVAYALDDAKPLLIAFDIGSPGFTRELSNVPAVDASAFVGLVQEASIADRTPGYNVEDRIYLVERIDVA